MATTLVASTTPAAGRNAGPAPPATDGGRHRLGSASLLVASAPGGPGVWADGDALGWADLLYSGYGVPSDGRGRSPLSPAATWLGECDWRRSIARPPDSLPLPPGRLRECLKRGLRKQGMIEERTIDLAHEPSSISHGFNGCRLADLGTPGSAGQAGRSPSQVFPAGGGGCDPVRVAHRLCLPAAAPRPAAVAIGLPLFLGLAAGWHLAGGPRRPAFQGSQVLGPPAQSQCGSHRQPERENHGKRGPRGYDAGKKVKGRKRHIVVDTQGLLLAVAVHPADVQDRDGA